MPRHDAYDTNDDDEPICVLKIELDGKHVEEIQVYRGQNPTDIVANFSRKFDLSDNAQHRLLKQIQE